MVTITMDDAHKFAQGLIANGWLNEDPNCVDTLYRQLAVITAPPAGYELAPSIATLEMQVAGQAVGVNAAWSFAKCYRAMLDAQPAPAIAAQLADTAPSAGGAVRLWQERMPAPRKQKYCVMNCSGGFRPCDDCGTETIYGDHVAAHVAARDAEITDLRAALAAAPLPQVQSKAARDVLVERERQIDRLDRLPEYDDESKCGEIAAYAAYYAMPEAVRDWPATETGYGETFGEAIIPADWSRPKPCDRRRELVKAGALVLAEIERLDRADDHANPTGGL